jgi:hypothetical protein
MSIHQQITTFLQPSSTTPNFIASPLGIVQVFGYTPSEGEQGVPITVHINFKHDCHEAVHVRLVVGTKPIATTVRELFIDGYAAWQLEGAAPPFRKQAFKSVTVPLTVEAFNSTFTLLDSVRFGEFVYWESGQQRFFCFFCFVL